MNSMRIKAACLFYIVCLFGCTPDKECSTSIKGHLVEGTTRMSLPNVKVTLFDDSKIYAVVFSNDSGMFSMATPHLAANHNYTLSFHWDDRYPSKEITVVDIPEIYDLGDFVVYDSANPYNYTIFDGYMIHKTLNGLYTFDEAKNACKNLRDGYDDWILPEADYLDLLADEKDLAIGVAETGWYWTSWITNGYNTNYYYGLNIMTDELNIITDQNEKMKVLPVRKIN